MFYADRLIVSKDWITLLIVGCVLLYTIAKFLYPKRFQEFMLLPITNKYFLVQGRNDQIQHPFNILLFGTQVISISLFLYLIIEIWQPEIVQENSWIFVQILTVFTVFVLIKFFIEKIISFIFDIDGVIHGYLYHKLTYRNLISVLFFLMNIVFYYAFQPSKTVLIFLIVLVVFANLISLFYSYKTYAKLIFNHFFYFILYLCALEIAPYIILYKMIV